MKPVDEEGSNSKPSKGSETIATSLSAVENLKELDEASLLAWTRGDHVYSAEYLRRALLVDPQDATRWFIYTQRLLSAGKPGAAWEAIKCTLDLDPTNADALDVLIELGREQNQGISAVTLAVDRLAEEISTSPDAHRGALDHLIPFKRLNAIESLADSPDHVARTVARLYLQGRGQAVTADDELHGLQEASKELAALQYSLAVGRVSEAERVLRQLPSSDIPIASVRRAIRRYMTRGQHRHVVRLSEFYLSAAPNERWAEEAQAKARAELKAAAAANRTERSPKSGRVPSVDKSREPLGEASAVEASPTNAAGLGRPLTELEATYVVDANAIVELSISAENISGGAKSGLIQLIFLDENGEVVLPAGVGPAHPELGEYRYVPDGLDGPESRVFDVRTPARAASLRILGHQWKPKSQTVVHELQVVSQEKQSGVEDRTLAEFVDGIGREDRLVIIYSTAPPIGHETLALRPNRLAKEYAKAGIYVIFMPFGSLQGHSPNQGERVQQIEGSRLPELLAVLEHRRGNRTTFVCSSYPDVRCASSVDELVSRGWSYVYEVRDEMEEFNRVGYSKWFRPSLEAYVASRSTSVVTVSPRLAEKIDIVVGRQVAEVVPNGVTDDLLERSTELRQFSSWSDKEKKKVGYIGHLTPSWFDWRTVIALANSRPDLDFEIVGHGAPATIALPSNLMVLGPRTHTECVEIARSWAVGLIPFLPTPLTTAVDPNKLYEYLALGIKTVSIDMGSVGQSPLTWVYKHPRDIGSTLKSALAYDVTREDADAVDMYLAQCNWAKRAERMTDIFQDGVRLEN